MNFRQNWICRNCSNNLPSETEENSSFLAGISAAALNDRFNDMDLEQDADDFDLLLENSSDKHYEPEDLNNLLVNSNNSDLFTMCINIRGLNIQKNFAKLEALV